ncbi:MAG: LysM peptidoglycan-binding domain-containing protein [Myxococcota bacterium]|nr:LysM peptidoglycan-binding domain-containing protein [Myxococcota bacterium]
MLKRTLASTSMFLFLVALPHHALAAKERSYVVQSGDSVAKVANHFGVSQSDLMEANNIRDAQSLQPGQEIVIPDELRGGSRGHVVKLGDTLVRIAKRYKVSVKGIQEVNKLGDAESLTIGRTLLIPGSEMFCTIGTVQGKLHAPVHIVRWRTGQSARLYLTSKGGGVNQKARKVLSELAAPRLRPGAKGKKARKPQLKLLHPRLVQLLSRVAERYPGRAIQIISGHRPNRTKQHRSKHAQGRALDFRVDGVNNHELYAFIRSLPKTGTGYYPNSMFVHLDVRDQSVTWTDYSGPGQTAQYRKPTSDGDLEAMADVESAAESPPEESTDETPTQGAPAGDTATESPMDPSCGQAPQDAPSEGPRSKFFEPVL